MARNDNESMFIAGDWGTSHLKLFLYKIPGDDANNTISVVDERSGPGIAQCQGQAPDKFFPLINDWSKQYGKLPILLSGMAGSNIGWKQAPYLQCPADLQKLSDQNLSFIEQGHKVTIVSGVACTNPLGTADFLRGEEVEIFGWLLQKPERMTGAHLLCLPGTHTKWALVNNGTIQSFWTSLTGEVFSALREHSVLLQEKPAPFNEDVFLSGIAKIADMGAQHLMSALFSVRGRQIAKELSTIDAESYLSACLIGADILSAIEIISNNFYKDYFNGEKLSATLIGDPAFCRFFAMALEVISVDSEIYNSADVVINCYKELFLSKEV